MHADVNYVHLYHCPPDPVSMVCAMRISNSPLLGGTHRNREVEKGASSNSGTIHSFHHCIARVVRKTKTWVLILVRGGTPPYVTAWTGI